MSGQLELFENENSRFSIPSEEIKRQRDNLERRAREFMNECCPRCAFEDYKGQQCIHFMDFHYWLKTFSVPDESGYPRRKVCSSFCSKYFKSMINRHTPLPFLRDKPRDTALRVHDAYPDPDEPFGDKYPDDEPCGDSEDTD